MLIEVMKFEKKGTCDLCGKEGEVAVLRVPDGKERRLLKTKLDEILVWTASLPDVPNGRVPTAQRPPVVQQH